jgi:hypothetical protein
MAIAYKPFVLARRAFQNEAVQFCVDPDRSNVHLPDPRCSPAFNEVDFHKCYFPSDEHVNQNNKNHQIVP